MGIEVDQHQKEQNIGWNVDAGVPPPPAHMGAAAIPPPPYSASSSASAPPPPYAPSATAPYPSAVAGGGPPPYGYEPNDPPPPAAAGYPPQAVHYNGEPQQQQQHLQPLQVQQGQYGGCKVCDVPLYVRMGFLRKVYSLLALLILEIVVISVALMFIPNVSTNLANNTWVVYVVMVPAIIFLIALIMKRKSHPTNMILLFFFSLFEALEIGIICATYKEVGGGVAVAIAFGATLVVFLALTVFTFQSRVDWSFLGAGLMAGLWVFIFWGIMMGLLGFRRSYLYSLLGALLFCGFIVYDTNAVLRRYSPDDFMLAVLDLYLDFINLFLMILSMAGRRR